MYTYTSRRLNLDLDEFQQRKNAAINKRDANGDESSMKDDRRMLKDFLDLFIQVRLC
jgi:hypothetical protein